MYQLPLRVVVFIAFVCTIIGVPLLPSAARTSTKQRGATATLAGIQNENNRTVRTSRWVSATVNRTRLAVNDVLIITFTVNNYQPGSIKSYPFRPTDSDITFNQDECWAKRKTGSVSLLYPKQSDNYRVMAGYTGWDKAHPTLSANCSSVIRGSNVTIDHPWRWGIGESALASSGIRTVTGRVRFTKAGTYTVFFGLIRDYAGYPNFPDCSVSKAPENNACFLNQVTIVVGDGGATPTKTRTKTATGTAVASSTPSPTGPTNTPGPATDTLTPSETRTASQTRTRTATRPARTATRPARTNTRAATAVPTNSGGGGGYPLPTYFATTTRTRSVRISTTAVKTITIYADTPTPGGAYPTP